MTERSETNEKWREFRREGRQRARRRMQVDIGRLTYLESEGLVRVQVMNAESCHFRVSRTDDAEVWCDYYPTRGTVCRRFGKGAMEEKGVRAVLLALGLESPAPEIAP